MANPISSLHIQAIQGIPLIHDGDQLDSIILSSLKSNGVELEDGDIVVVAQKIVSKAEGRLIRLSDVNAGEDATKLAEETEMDPRLVHLILDESTEVVRKKAGVLIVLHLSLKNI